MDKLITAYASLLLKYEPASVRASMEKRGHGKLWRRALLEAERSAGKDNARTEQVITLARRDDAAKHAENIAKVNAANARITLDPSIVGGFILRNGFARTDRSYKTTLINLYRKVTA